MVWVVEDGTIVTDANTYISTTDAIAYAAARGITISISDVDVLMTQAMDFLESRVYSGDLTEDDQPLQQPRENVYVNGILQTSSQIVSRMSKSECEIMMAISQGYDPMAPVTRTVKEESFAVFKKVYMDNSVDNPISTKINMWLAPLLGGGYGGVHFRVDRSYG